MNKYINSLMENSRTCIDLDSYYELMEKVIKYCRRHFVIYTHAEELVENCDWGTTVSTFSYYDGEEKKIYSYLTTVLGIIDEEKMEEMEK